MKTHFTHQIVLIELNTETTFKTTFAFVAEKLSELICWFPSLVVLWARNSAHSAQLILKLKKGAGLFKSPSHEVLEQRGLLRRSKELKVESIEEKSLDFVGKFAKKKESMFKNVG